jgi:hypothetical protein
MIDRRALVRDLSWELKALERDLRRRTEEDPTLAAELTGEYERAFALGRTAATYGAWRDRQVTQAAVAWLLGGVFVRFCEDNALVRPVWLAGPPGRRAEAVERHEAYFRAHPERNDRDWLLEAMVHLRDLTATAGVFDRRNPLWRIRPSADAAERLVGFWRRTGPDGELAHDFRDPELDTRFLGDVYQDLSEEARQEFALLQTPEFVEEFILDRTLERALEERGGEVEGLRLIDPACGSGHFLLGAFERLLRHWHREAPIMDARERVQRVLDALHGVDLNPFAVAIARFRLMVAAMRGGGDRSLEPGVGYRYHLAVGDSLLHGTRQRAFEGMGMPVDDEELAGFAYAAEDLSELRAILKPGAYDVVVANPPYVTVKDAALNRRYRERYGTCYREYALAVPFCERLFELAKRPDEHGRNAGWVGAIMSNSFMKREFGKKLIEEFLSKRKLVEVIDTSGAYIPGHGTPTVILIGRNEDGRNGAVRAVLGIRGEPGVPADPARGLVWTAIRKNVDSPGAETPYVSVVDMPRRELASHPWSLSGGGAGEMKQRIEATAASRLGKHAFRIGVFGITGADEEMITPRTVVSAHCLELEAFQPLTVGDNIRDFCISPGDLRSPKNLWKF